MQHGEVESVRHLNHILLNVLFALEGVPTLSDVAERVGPLDTWRRVAAAAGVSLPALQSACRSRTKKARPLASANVVEAKHVRRVCQGLLFCIALTLNRSENVVAGAF